VFYVSSSAVSRGWSVFPCVSVVFIVIHTHARAATTSKCQVSMLCLVVWFSPMVRSNGTHWKACIVTSLWTGYVFSFLFTCSLLCFSFLPHYSSSFAALSFPFRCVVESLSCFEITSLGPLAATWRFHVLLTHVQRPTATSACARGWYDRSNARLTRSCIPMISHSPGHCIVVIVPPHTSALLSACCRLRMDTITFLSTLD